MPWPTVSFSARSATFSLTSRMSMAKILLRSRSWATCGWRGGGENVTRGVVGTTRRGVEGIGGESGLVPDGADGVFLLALGCDRWQNRKAFSKKVAAKGFVPRARIKRQAGSPRAIVLEVASRDFSESVVSRLRICQAEHHRLNFAMNDYTALRYGWDD